MDEERERKNEMGMRREGTEGGEKRRGKEE